MGAAQNPSWQIGDCLAHRDNPELGPGRVVALEGRRLQVRFPEAGQTLTVSAYSDALTPLPLGPGIEARLEAEGSPQRVTVAEVLEDGEVLLADGRRVPAARLWPVVAAASPLDRLARGKVDAFEDFANRLDALRLGRLREADGLGSFLGGRIRLFPHQLYAAERATRADPVRWLLADEVGLGKTVEACLIMNRLIHTGRAERTLVVAPATLTLQWLGELWRKYHQIFVLLDKKRLADVGRDHGEGFNPFEVHRRAIVSLETLVADPKLTRQAVEAGIDLLVVDEAHHLKRPPKHPGNAAYRAIAPITRLGRGVLLLSATPLEDDAHGFFRLLQVLRPDEFPQEESFDERLRRREPLPPCTSATRRADIGGLPPRQPIPIDLDPEPWQPFDRLERHLRAAAADDPVGRRRQAERITRALASPAALSGHLEPGDDRGKELLAPLLAEPESDPRVRWLVEQAPTWRRKRQKSLVFVAHRETLEVVRQALERQGHIRVGLFHEQLPPERRDVEVAQFRLPDGPAVLITTECGGEGRNFEFCKRLVLFDLPWNPAVVEQRIGRLDRIGRSRPTEVVYFRPPSGLGAAIAALYEEVGLFAEPLGSLEGGLRSLAREIERAATEGSADRDPRLEDFQEVLRQAREEHDRVQEAAYHELHRQPYHAGMVQEILDRVPDHLDALIEDVVLRAAARFGFEVEQQGGDRGWLIELGHEALVDQLPGVPAGSRFLGTFDRETAVADEGLDFFASGHPLVEGVLAELEDGPRGRVALLQLRGEEEVFGLLALFKKGPEVEAVAVDLQGRPRPDLAERLTSRHLEPEHVDPKKWTAQAAWEKTIRRLEGHLKALRKTSETPQAVAAFRIRR